MRSSRRITRLEQARTQAALMRGLCELANRLNATSDPGDTITRIAGFTTETLRCGHAHVLLAVDVAGHPAVQLPAQAAGEPELDPAGFGIADGSEASSPWCAFLASRAPGCSGRGPIAYATLKTGTDRVGLLIACEPRARAPFDKESLKTLRQVADTAAVALWNQVRWDRLEAEAQERARLLEQAQERLAIADHVKSEFLAFVSHELRTPLLHLSAVNLIDGDLEREALASIVEIARNGYSRLEKFTLKSLRYFEWLSLPPRAKEISDVGALVEAAVASIRGQARLAVIDVRLPDARCEVPVDRACMEEIVLTLVENAVKFSRPQQPRVTVTVERLPGGVSVTVTDRGRGFPSDWSREIFRPFTVADTPHHREGSGLSLAIVAAMVRAHGGTIRAASDGFGTGATFIVELPASPAQLQPIPALAGPSAVIGGVTDDPSVLDNVQKAA